MKEADITKAPAALFGETSIEGSIGNIGHLGYFNIKVLSVDLEARILQFQLSDGRLGAMPIPITGRGVRIIKPTSDFVGRCYVIQTVPLEIIYDEYGCVFKTIVEYPSNLNETGDWIPVR